VVAAYNIDEAKDPMQFLGADEEQPQPSLLRYVTDTLRNFDEARKEVGAMAAQM
jgi:hypothetical protein